MRERAITVGSGPLIGVVSEPDSPPPTERPAVVVLNSGIVHRVGPGRLSVRLARQWCAAGHVVARFDHAGIGDSPARSGAGLGNPSLWRAAAAGEVREVLDELECTHGVERFVLIGLCSGAATSFRVALEDARVVGAALMNPQGLDADPEWNTEIKNKGWMRDYLRNSLSSADSWRRAFTGRVQYKRLVRVVARSVRRRLVPSARAAEVNAELGAELQQLVRRGVRLLFLFTEADHAQDYFEAIAASRLGELRESGYLETAVIPQADHTFTLLANQAHVLEETQRWRDGAGEWGESGGRACTLAGAPRRLWRAYDLLAQRTGERRVPGGLELAFPGGAGLRGELRELLRCGHPDFRVELVEGDAGGSAGQQWVRIEGPEGAQEYLADLVALSSRVQARRKSQGTWRVRRATAALRGLPEFLVLGAARCGTTELYERLVAHPEVERGWRKEVGFFDRNFERGVGWYRAHFPLGRGWGARGRRTCDATPEYLLHPHAPRRVRELLPEARLIVVLREPVTRAHSHYHLQLRNGYEHLSFEDAVEREEERIGGELERMLADESYPGRAYQHYSYLARGRYAEQLERWLACFPREQLLVLTTEDLGERAETTLSVVLEFLGLSPWKGSGEVARRHALPRAALEPGLRARLAEYFAPHNQRLFELLGRDLGWNDSAQSRVGEQVSR